MTITPLTTYIGTVPARSQDTASFNTNVNAALTFFTTSIPEHNVSFAEFNAAVVATEAQTGQDVIDSAASAAAALVTKGETTAIKNEAEAISASLQALVNFKGSWADLTGAHVVPTAVLHNDLYWTLLNDLADITASEPGVTTDWEKARQIPIYQEFTSSGTYNVPSWATFIMVELVGAGAGGGGGDTSYNGGGGGGEGLREIILVSSLGSTVSATIGAGGIGSQHNGGALQGGNGGATSFGNIQALGGIGGWVTNPSSRAPEPRSADVSNMVSVSAAGREGLSKAGLGGYTTYNTTTGQAQNGTGTIYGGGGGAGAPTGTEDAGVGGVSELAGDGGGSASDSMDATAGEYPGGGGGAGYKTTKPAADGADGRIRVWAW